MRKSSMALATIDPPTIKTLADLLKRLGDIPLERVRFRPAPGTATEDDLIELDRRGDSLFELVDGTVVDTAVGFQESLVTGQMSFSIISYLHGYDRGICVGGNCLIRFAPGLVRCPSVAFLSWDKFPNHQIPNDPITDIVPDLIAETLRDGNTPAEMTRKVGEYFEAGVRLVWLIDPNTRSARIYSASDRCVLIGVDQSLDGRDVLPGFSVPLADLFRQLARLEEMIAGAQSSDT
jgi:Uma2 family endonuclease